MDLLSPMCAPKGRFDQRHRIVCQQRQAKGEQSRLGIAQRIDLTSQRRGNVTKRGLYTSPLAVHPSQLGGRGSGAGHMGEDMELGVPVAGRHLELNGNAT